MFWKHRLTSITDILLGKSHRRQTNYSSFHSLHSLCVCVWNIPHKLLYDSIPKTRQKAPLFYFFGWNVKQDGQKRKGELHDVWCLVIKVVVVVLFFGFSAQIRMTLKATTKNITGISRILQKKKTFELFDTKQNNLIHNERITILVGSWCHCFSLSSNV